MLWIYISGNYLYLADQDAGLQVIDISNPANPILAGNYETSGSALGVYVRGNYVYVGGW